MKFLIQQIKYGYILNTQCRNYILQTNHLKFSNLLPVRFFASIL